VALTHESISWAGVVLRTAACQIGAYEERPRLPKPCPSGTEHGGHVLSSSAYNVRVYQLECNTILLYHSDRLGGGSVDDKN